VSKHSFILNGKKVSVDAEDNVRLLWVLRDILKVRGPKYGCGIRQCMSCTSHLNGKAFNPCSVPISDIQSSDRITTIEGLARTAKGRNLHPVQEAWIKHSVPQCGYCQPGQIMAAVALINRVKKSGRRISEADLDTMRNVCRCGTYPRIREAIKDAAQNM
jgi:isoquinoline 1-oxidoreductase alpha subunit